MNVIPLSLAPECIVRGDLRESDNTSELSQDMLEVRLPGGLSIEVGWVPDNDPSGAYEILLCLGMDVKLEITTRSPWRAKSAIERIANHYLSLIAPECIGDDVYRMFAITSTSTSVRELVA